MKTMILLCVAALAGCATPDTNPVQASNGQMVTINWGLSGMKNAPNLAEQECQKHGKHAKLVSTQDYYMFFNCD